MSSAAGAVPGSVLQSHVSVLGQVTRQEKMAEHQAEQEMHAQRALARAAAPAFQKHGKPVMFRSALLRHESTAGTAVAVEGQDHELDNYLELMDLQ